MSRVTPVLILLAACSWSEDTYFANAAEAECELGLECFDEARLNFLGWTDLESCVALEGPEFAATGVGCATFDSSAAKACVKELRDRSCPDEGQEPSYPAVCDAVFADCGGEPVDTGA